MSNPHQVHSKLSFSSRYRWRACPISVHLSKDIPDDLLSSPAAREGTSAHIVAEWYVRQAFQLPGAPALHVACPDVRGNIDGLGVTDWPAWQEQLRKHGRDYLAFIRSLIPADEPDAHVSLETPVNIASIHRFLFGTLDLRIWLPKRRVLIIVDYKYGFQDVEVGTVDDPNPQLAAYAVASVEGMHPKAQADLQGIILAVYQPRVPLGDPAKVLHLPPSWIAAERRKLHNEVTAVENPGAPRPGDHCRYCKAVAVCPSTHNALKTALEQYAGGRNLLAMNDEEIIALWSARKAVETLMDSVDERVRGLAKAGHASFKVTQQQGRRMWSDPKLATETLLALGRVDLLQPIALSDALNAIPAGLQDELVRRSLPSARISLVDAPAPNVVRDMFHQYVSKGA